MKSVDPELKDAIVAYQRDQGLHGPHNFVDSAEGSPGRIDHSDPEVKRVIDGLDEMISEGFPGVKRLLAEF